MDDQTTPPQEDVTQDVTLADALVTNTPTLKPDQTVESAIKMLEKKKLRNAPVIDAAGDLLGFFSVRHLIKNLLPVSVTLDSGLQMNVPIGMAPGMDKRLIKLKAAPVSSLMEEKVKTVTLATPRWEAAVLLIEERRPLLVLEPNSRKFLGVVTELSLVQALENKKK